MARCWKKDGWTCIQEADAEKHILEISIRAENGTIVECNTRHHDGEEGKGVVTCKGEPVLPCSIDQFKKLFKAGSLDIK